MTALLINLGLVILLIISFILLLFAVSRVIRFVRRGENIGTWIGASFSIITNGFVFIYTLYHLIT